MLDAFRERAAGVDVLVVLLGKVTLKALPPVQAPMPERSAVVSVRRTRSEIRPLARHCSCILARLLHDPGHPAPEEDWNQHIALRVPAHDQVDKLVTWPVGTVPALAPAQEGRHHARQERLQRFQHLRVLAPREPIRNVPDAEGDLVVPAETSNPTETLGSAREACTVLPPREARAHVPAVQLHVDALHKPQHI